MPLLVTNDEFTLGKLSISDLRFFVVNNVTNKCSNCYHEDKNNAGSNLQCTYITTWLFFPDHFIFRNIMDCKNLIWF